MAFPADRPRRLRRTETLRNLVRETRLVPSDFMLPLFAVSGRGVRKPIASMPGVAQLSVDVSPRTAVDVGYDFTRWHASFSGSSVLDPSRPADQALLLEAREHAITFGVRWKP